MPPTTTPTPIPTPSLVKTSLKCSSMLHKARCIFVSSSAPKALLDFVHYRERLYFWLISRVIATADVTSRLIDFVTETLLLVPLVLRGSSGSPWFLWFSVVPLVLCGSSGSPWFFWFFVVLLVLRGSSGSSWFFWFS